jgi:hypothetical protein
MTVPHPASAPGPAVPQGAPGASGAECQGCRDGSDGVAGSYPEVACKRVMAVLAPRPEWDERLCDALESAFGAIDYRGAFTAFEGAAYYAPEMGAPLSRGWLSFRGLADPAGLADWKHAARALEDAQRCGPEGARPGGRVWNLDVGYLDTDKLVLASFKQGPFKLYLGRGVWADAILGYSRGLFSPLPGAFPDFRDGRYDKSLGIIRDKLKADLRRGTMSPARSAETKP